jgi:hypothetical protein
MDNAQPNNAALYDARRRQQGSSSQLLDSIASGSNCTASCPPFWRPFSNSCDVVDRDEVDRLRKRFMKLDKVRLDSLSCDEATCLPFSVSRTTAVPSNEMSSSHYLKCPQTLSQPGTSLPSMPYLSCVAIRSVNSLLLTPTPFLQHDSYLRRRWRR